MNRPNSISDTRLTGFRTGSRTDCEAALFPFIGSAVTFTAHRMLGRCWKELPEDERSRLVLSYPNPNAMDTFVATLCVVSQRRREAALWDRRLAVSVLMWTSTRLTGQSLIVSHRWLV